MSKLQKQIAASFREHLRRLSEKKCDRDGFDDEMDELRKVDQKVRMNIDEFYTASLGSSTSKNRFSEVRANEGTLVRLSPLTESDHVSYINANYIDGKALLGVPFVYIATQAPLSNTILDFWRMVYENNVGFIIMLSGEIENGKAKSETYWPRPGENLDFGVMTVKSISETKAFDLVYRTFLMRTTRGEEREVSHIQYCGWPDQGIPDTSAPLMEIIQVMGKSERSVQSPIVVHCSGGIGRTGVFIALHVTLAQFQQERKDINICKTVHILKLCRTGMVQRKDQYVFLCYAAQREMDRMILSAEKGIDLLKMQRRERPPRNSISIEKRSQPPMIPGPTPKGQYTQSTTPNQYAHQQRDGHSNLSHAIGLNKQELLENYLRRISSPNRSGAPPLQGKKGNNTCGENGVIRANVTSPSQTNRKANWVIQGTHRDSGSLAEELQHWQDRTKQMRFSTDGRGRGEPHYDREPHASQKLQEKPYQQQPQQQQQQKLRNDRAEGPNTRSPREVMSSSSDNKNNVGVVHISSPLKSLATDKKRYSLIDESTRNPSLASLRSTVTPVSIIVTPQEDTAHKEATNESDATGNDLATCSFLQSGNTETSERVNNAAEPVRGERGSSGDSSNKNKGVEFIPSSTDVASSTKTSGMWERGAGQYVATAGGTPPDSVTAIADSTGLSLISPIAQPITDEEFARL